MCMCVCVCVCLHAVCVHVASDLISIFHICPMGVQCTGACLVDGLIYDAFLSLVVEVLVDVLAVCDA